MQGVDYTTLWALGQELQRQWLPARIEQVYQRDRHTLSLALRTLTDRGWLTLSWHPQAARICLDSPPPRTPDTFTLSDQLRHQLKGLALIALDPLEPWERVLQLAIARRPHDPPLYYLYLEVMGKYSNLVLTDQNRQIITVAHQVNAQQSRIRTVQTGQPYTPPPPLSANLPRAEESFQDWQDQLQLIPGFLAQQWIKTYRGLSPMIVREFLNQAGLDATEKGNLITPTDLTPDQWQRLFGAWQGWMAAFTTGTFTGQLTSTGFRVHWDSQKTDDFSSLNDLIQTYYAQQLSQAQCQQLHHQLQQKLTTVIQKLHQKAQTFEHRLQEADNNQEYQRFGDLLMAHLSLAEPGLKAITLADFTDGSPVTIPLQPDKTLLQNAQSFYKRQQKLNRAREAIDPLLQAVNEELAYLNQVETSLQGLKAEASPDIFAALEEIREELIDQGYFPAPAHRRKTEPDFQPYKIVHPSGASVWIGRNNRQNDHLTFRVATDYDLWFHAQEIAGSHVLLRLPPGVRADQDELQWAADWAAYYSRGRGSEQVPVVYTLPKYVFKPRGSKPGMVVYQQETVMWGRPQVIAQSLPS